MCAGDSGTVVEVLPLLVGVSGGLDLDVDVRDRLEGRLNLAGACVLAWSRKTRPVDYTEPDGGATTMVSDTDGCPLSNLAGIRGKNQSRSFDCALDRLPGRSDLDDAMCNTIMTACRPCEVVRWADGDALIRV